MAYNDYGSFVWHNDERRKVAERVRKAHGIMAFVEALGIDFDSDWHWTDVSRHVADLIDPTCEVEGSIHHESIYDTTCYVMHKLSCGHWVRTEDTEPPFYCPHCGARVVSDDGR